MHHACRCTVIYRIGVRHVMMHNMLLFAIELRQLLRWHLLHHRNTIWMDMPHLRVFLHLHLLLHLLLVDVGAHGAAERGRPSIADHFELAKWLRRLNRLVIRRRRK